MGRARSGIVLAAGGSRRMGRPKALLDWAGRSLVAAHVEALASVADRVLVVLGADADRIAPAIPAAARVVVNRDWATSHPVDSLRLALEGVDGEALVTPVDVAPARPETLAALLTSPAPAVPVGPDGRAGHPVLLDRATIERIRAEAPPGGLRALLGAAARVRVADPLVAEDFDDPAAYERVLARTR